jgi:Holliday junction resolvase
MGKSQRDKGARNEVALVNTFKEAGLSAERVPLSGAAGGSFAGDIVLHSELSEDFKFEAKLRADGFKELYKWLGENDGLIVRADRKEALAVIRLTDFITMFKAHEGRP